MTGAVRCILLVVVRIGGCVIGEAHGKADESKLNNSALRGERRRRRRRRRVCLMKGHTDANANTQH